MEQHIENPPDNGLDLAARNSASRKKAYKLATMYIHGVLGAGNRMRLPSCVEDGVRALFPPVDGIVMGFREEWIFIFRSVKSVGRVLMEYVRIYSRIEHKPEIKIKNRNLLSQNITNGQLLYVYFKITGFHLFESWY